MKKKPRPLPVPDAETLEYWRACKRHKLMIQRCVPCSSFRFYPQAICPNCGSNKLEWVQATGKAKIFSFSVIHRAPSEAFLDDLPYVLALVELDEGVRMFSQIIEVELEKVQIGQPVEVVFKDISEDIALPFFRPL